MLVSSGLASGTLALIDGSGIAANGLAPSVDASTQADIQMDTAPTMSGDPAVAAPLVSMFATNSAALKATAVFACEKLRDDCVGVVTGITSTTWASPDG